MLNRATLRCPSSHALPVLCLFSFTLLMTSLAAFGQDLSDAANVSGTAEPAAVYCRDLGYETEIVKTQHRERLVCILPNGERVNAWDFYRGKVWPEYSYCERAGYETVRRVTDSGSFTKECAVCVDGQGREVGTVWDLMGLGARVLPQAGPVPKATRGRSRLSPPEKRDLPAALNWCDLGACSSVKHQGTCGSCWAFSTVGPLESAILIRDAIEVDLSEQWLMCCNQDNDGCWGGWMAHDYFEWKMDPCGGWGAVLEEDFPYTSSQEDCTCPFDHPYLIDEWAYVAGVDTLPDPEPIKQALLDRGPLSAGVTVNQAFSDYTGGVFNDCTTANVNHAVTLVGWDDEQGTEGIWIVKNSWGEEWGEDGYMRIEYGCSNMGFGSVWVGNVNPLRIQLPDGVPDALPADETTAITVQIDESTEAYVPGTGRVHHRSDGGPYQSSPLVHVGGDLYEATLGPPGCGETVEYYFSAEGVISGELRSPQDAPQAVYASLVGVLTPLFEDDFESDLGWTVESDSTLSAGAWERGVPVGNGGQGEPPADFDGSGSCYMTENAPGESDVDRGVTRLMSPCIDASGWSDVRVYYAVWYANCFDWHQNKDIFRVHLSNDDGMTWVQVDSLGPVTRTGWQKRSFAVQDFMAVTDLLRVRFDAADLEGPSRVEAGLDAFSVERLTCGETPVVQADRSLRDAGLRAAIPNPFHPGAAIRYELPRAMQVGLAIYDVRGRLVRQFTDSQTQPAGPHAILWDGRDAHDRPVASGVYF